jgi:16S rRNA processing protein RimM
MAPEGWIRLGTVRRARGNRGEVIVELHTVAVERFLEASPVTVFGPGQEPREIAVEQAWQHGDKSVLKLAGIDSIEAAEALRGVALCIRQEKRRAPQPGEVFFEDLIGCRIYNPAGELLGEVRDVYEEGAQVWLAVDRQDGREAALVPWVPAWFREQDWQNKRLTGELPEGLLELDQ